jgi:redox-sensitive bicupin YhaK (pirin superfamily)
MIEVVASKDRGHVDHGWLDTRHTFSFGNWYDENRMGFHSLRVINEDVVAPMRGFGKHFHDDMEILTYMISGAITHQDNTGGGGTLRAGEVQKMSAGRGIIHSEMNKSESEPAHLLQIWIVPKEFGIPPSYGQRRIDELAKRGRSCLIASADGRDGSFTMAQDADVYATVLGAGERLEPKLAMGRRVWVQVVRGALDLNGVTLHAGDGAAVSDEKVLRFAAKEEVEFLTFDLS